MSGKEIFQWQTQSGDPVVINDDALGKVTITPQAQALTIRCPYGGWVWNRPLAILVERAGETERLPVMDVTRIVQLGLFSLSLIFSLYILLSSISGRRHRHE